MEDRIYKLAVLVNNGLVELYFKRRSDAQTSYDNTYTYLRKKPTYKIIEIEVLNYVKAF